MKTVQPAAIPGSHRGVALVLAILVFVPNNGAPTGVFTLASLAVILILGASIAASTLVQPRLYLLGGFFVIAAVALMGGGAFSDLLSLVRIATMMLLLALAASRLTKEGVVLVRRTVVALGLVEAVIALAQKLTGTPVIWGWLGDTSLATFGQNPLWGDPVGRAPGTMAHAIPLGMLLGLAIIVLLTGSVTASIGARTAMLIVLAAGLAASGTRSALVVLVAVLLYMFLLSKSASRSRAILKTTAVLIGIAVSLTVDVARASLWSSLEGTASLDHRAQSWTTMAALLFDQPVGRALLGQGWGAPDRIAQSAIMQSDTILAIDNNFATLMAIGGLVGLSLIVTIAVHSVATGGPMTRACMLFILGMFMSFDIVLWAAPMSLFVLFAFLPENVTTHKSADLDSESMRAGLIPSA